MQPVSIFVLAQNDVSPITTAPPAAGAPAASGVQAPGPAPAGAPAGPQSITVTTGSPPPAGAANKPVESGWANAMPFVMLLVAFAFLFIFQARTTKKEKAKRDEMFASLKKGDKIQTIGGALGVIAEVREKDVIVKFDDATRIKFVKSAIAAVVSDDSSDEKPK